MNTNKILSFLGALIVGGAIGYYFGSTFASSPSCPVPVNLTQVQNDEASITVSWDAAAGARFYTVIARDSTDLENVAGSVVVQTNSATIPGLQPNKGYKVEVFSICEDAGKFYISQEPIVTGAHTGWIVIEDMALFNDPKNCPYGNCDIPVSDGDSCFSWDSDKAYYSIEIYERSSNTLLVRNYLEKLSSGDTLNVRSFTQTPCSGMDDNVISGASQGACDPVVPFTFCGRFQLPGATDVTPYQIKVGLAECCINLSPAQYRIIVRKCTATPI